MQTLAQAQQHVPAPQPHVYLASPASQQMSPEKRAELRRLVEEMTSECTAFSYAPLHAGLVF